MLNPAQQSVADKLSQEDWELIGKRKGWIPAVYVGNSTNPLYPAIYSGPFDPASPPPLGKHDYLWRVENGKWVRA